jgi:hypothetical protein
LGEQVTKEVNGVSNTIYLVDIVALFLTVKHILHKETNMMRILGYRFAEAIKINANSPQQKQGPGETVREIR